MKMDLIDQLITEWHKERPDIDTSGMAIVGRIIRLGQLMSASAAESLKTHGLAYTDFDILATLRRKGRNNTLTPTELSKAVLLTSGAMTTALDRLERASLIQRKRSETDRRSHSITLTGKGCELAEAAAEDRFRDAAKWNAKLPAEFQSQLAKLLKLFNE